MKRDCLAKEDRRLSRLAERITRDLFTDVVGNKACRLVMAFRKPGANPLTTQTEYQTGAGLGDAAVKDRILKHLRRSNRKSNNRKS